MNEEEKIKDKELNEKVTRIMYQKLTSPEQEPIREYIKFLKSKISELKMNKRDKEYYKKSYENEMQEKFKYKEALENLAERYNELCKKQANIEIELDIAKAKIDLLEKGKEE